jgi:branched-chain amino acid transport system permease protein
MAAALNSVARSTLVRHVVAAAVVGAVLFALTLRFSSYHNLELAQVATYVVAAAALTILTGTNGQVSLGHGALMAIGAYTTAVLTVKHGFSMWVAWLVAIGITTVAGTVVGAAAARLRGPYLAGATLALALGIPQIPLHFANVLGGESGYAVGNGESLTSTTSPQQFQAWTIGLAALVSLVLLRNVLRSRYGRSFRAVRDDEIAASLCGLSVQRTQVLAFVISAAGAGLAGGMFADVVGQVSPGAFPVTLSIQLLAVIVIGGLGSLAGALWGSLFLVFLPNWTSSNSSASGANISIMVYGGTLVLIMIFFPQGIQGLLRLAGGFVRARLPRRPARHDRRPAVVVEPLQEREESR